MELYFPVVLDGANGTELQKRGYDGSVCAEKWVLEHPEVMQELQQGYIDAGSRVIYAPTFGANRAKLEENGICGQTAQYNRDLVKISRELADHANETRDPSERVLVAGDIATSGKFLAPLGDVSFDELYEMYLEQVSAMEEAGVDLYVIETIMTVPDARAALLAVRDVSDKPVLVSFTCDENGRTLTGSDVKAACVIMQGMGIEAFGLNCSTGPKEMLEQIKRVSEAAEVPLAAKPNAGLPKTMDGRVVYDCPPDEFAGYTKAFADEGVVLFGGCCGTGTEHIAAVSRALGDIRFEKKQPLMNDSLICATEKDMFFIERGTEIETIISCGPDLEEEIAKANRNDDAVMAIEIRSEADIENFEVAQYAIRKPLCIVCDDRQLLDRALRLYQGRALYAGSLSEEELAPLVKKYGMQI